MTNGSDVYKVLGPLNVLRGDVREGPLANGHCDRLLYGFLAEGTEHERKSGRKGEG